MTPYIDDPDFTLYVGDALQTLRDLPDESVDCVVTSPPYWGLRDYGTGEWEGGNPDCDHKRLVMHDQPADRPRGWDGNFRNTGTPLPIAYSGTCGKCGARRVDQQLGLEPTPAQYVQRMVMVFREVRRVLAAHGTCWVNLGDSYHGGGYANHAVNGPEWLEEHGGDRRRSRQQDRINANPSLKPKDLVGIPWRVAFALQQPYYAGRIKDESDRRWLAGILDSEGCIHIHRRKAGTDSGAKFTKKDGTEVSYARTKDTYGVMVSIDNTSKALVDRCHEIIGQGSRYTHEKATGKQQRKQTLYRLTLTGQQSRELLRELYPHLVAKQQEARIAYSSPSSGEGAAQAHEAIKLLHNGSPTTVDAQAPPSLLEAGWFLRSDIVWSKKPNPMPESVTDRPTKAHEYVFLLTKQPRYWFDQEAVREPAEWARWGDQTNGKHEGSGSAAGWIGDKPKNELQKRNPSWAERKAAGATRGNLAFGEKVGAGTQRGVHGEGLSHDLGDPARGRNIRSVWEIATQPFSDWKQTVRRVRVEPDAAVDGKKRTTSPDCPVHGGHPAPASTPPDGEHGGDESSRSEHTGHHETELQGEPAPTLTSLEPDSAPGSSGSPAPPDSPTATGRSKGSRKTPSRSASGDTASAQTPDRIEDTSPSHATPAPDGSDSPGSSETPGRISHRCTCEWYVEYTDKTSHFATFPEELARRCILAGCPERVCRVCGKPSERIVERGELIGKDRGGNYAGRETTEGVNRFAYTEESGKQFRPGMQYAQETVGWSDCGCLLSERGESVDGTDPGTPGVRLRGTAVPADEVSRSENKWRPGIVLDPFLGSGTVALVARNHGRHAIGIELSAEYAELAAKRTRQLSLLAT